MVDQDAPIDDVKMTFGEHLEELRKCIIRGLIGTLVVFAVVVAYNDEVVKFVVKPYQDAAKALRGEELLVSIGVSQGFFAYMKVAIIVALLIGAPIWMYQFWQFIGAGLYKHEKRWVYRFAPLMVVLFAGGVFFGYTTLIPLGLRYLLAFGDPTVLRNWIGLQEYLAFFTLLTLVLGITFELPIVMALLAKIGLGSVSGYRSKRRYFILIAFIIAAILTPPDAVTQSLLATPMLILYEVGIFLSWLIQGDAGSRTINWPYWRTRIIILVVLIAVGLALWPRISRYMDARVVAERIDAEATEGGQGWTFGDLFKLTGFLSFSWDVTFKVSSDEERDIWAVGGPDHAELVSVSVRNDHISKTGDDAKQSRFLVRGAGQQVEINRIDRLEGERFILPLISAVELSELKEVRRIDRLLHLLVGAQSPKVVLSDSPSEDERDEAARIWREWFEAHPTFVFERTG